MAFGHQYAVLVNRIRRIRGDHHIAGADCGEKKMCQGVFCADCDDGFLFGIERHVIIGLVAAGDFFAEFRNPARLRIPVIARIA